ncbi:MAG: tripartite tricarboxylate transporter substrate binding protein, partial [Burkholderiales bacterium]
LQIVVSAAPGGSPDILARILAPKLAERLGKAVTVDNRVGGAGNIAAAHVAKSSPDGHTLFVAHDGLAINQTLFDNLPFHATQSFAPVIQAFNSPQVLAVHSDVPAKTLAEFVSLARAHPEKYALASPAIGTTGQLGVLLLQNAANIKVKPVVYRSAQPALTDVLGKHADGIFVTLAPALPHIKEGRLRALAVSTAKRDRALPDVPTFAELGIKELTFASWQGIVAPANTPRPVVERLNKELNAILADSEVRAAFAKQAFEPVGGTPEEFARLISESIDKWAAVIRANNIRADA